MVIFVQLLGNENMADYEENEKCPARGPACMPGSGEKHRRGDGYSEGRDPPEGDPHGEGGLQDQGACIRLGEK